MGEEPASTQDLVRWAEALAGIAKTGLAFTDSLYERERFEEILNVAGDIRAVAAEILTRPKALAVVGPFDDASAFAV